MPKEPESSPLSRNPLFSPDVGRSAAAEAWKGGQSSKGLFIFHPHTSLCSVCTCVHAHARACMSVQGVQVD